MTLQNRKATRYQELSKARAEVARLFPLAMDVIEGVLKYPKTPRNLRFEAAKLIYYQHLGKPPAMIEIDLEGELVGLSQADRMARATAEARKAFQDALAKAGDLSVLDDFREPEPVPSHPGLKDQTSLSPEACQRDVPLESTSSVVDATLEEDAQAHTPFSENGDAQARAQGGRGPCEGEGVSIGGLNADRE